MPKRRDTLMPRTVRVRNALLRQAAAQLGLSVPDAEHLRGIPDHMSLHEAVRWWQAQAAPGDTESATPRPWRPHLALRMACITAITVLGLALTYGRAQ